jgi:hypothetical protein
MFGEIERPSCETSLLSAMSNQLRACRGPGEAGAVIAHFAGQLFPAVPGALYMRRPGDGFYALAASWGGFPAATGDDKFSPYECWALQRGRGHLNVEPLHGPACEHIGRGGVQHPAQRHLCLPVTTFQGDVLGLLHFRCPLPGGAAAPQKPTPSTLRLAMIMTDCIASALAI